MALVVVVSCRKSWGNPGQICLEGANGLNCERSHGLDVICNDWFPHAEPVLEMVYIGLFNVCVTFGKGSC
jgi:hypothetical protein